MTGLREHKKQQTRQAIAEAAWQLFRARGFDAVTVDEVAMAADVSKKTVFNYFATKEDLVFDRAEDREEALVRAVRRVGMDLSLAESFRDLFHESLGRIERLRAKVGHGSGGFFDMVHGNPALLRRLHEHNAHLLRVLAIELAAQFGTDPDDPVTVATAATLLGAQTALHRALRARVASGASTPTIRRGHRRDIDRVYRAIRDGVRTYPSHEQHAGSNASRRVSPTVQPSHPSGKSSGRLEA